MTIRLPVIDCHQHLYDSQQLRYDLFTAPSEGFAAVVGDYTALPRVYGPEDYERDVAGLNVVGSVWVEFISDAPLEEVRWAANVTRTNNRESSLVAVVDFANPGLNDVLDQYQEAGRVRCVRQHMGWHPTHELLRFTPTTNMMDNPAWRRGLASLRHRGMICELEIFSPQLAEFSRVAVAFPDIEFILPVMGWPTDLSEGGHLTWKRGLAALSKCSNVAIKIFGFECIFGVSWTLDQVRPWVIDAIDIFGPDRSLFASHLPICKLACRFKELYAAYYEITGCFTDAERHRMFYDNALRERAAFCGLARADSPGAFHGWQASYGKDK